jgi:hypothetical protein
VKGGEREGKLYCWIKETETEGEEDPVSHIQLSLRISLYITSNEILLEVLQGHSKEKGLK